MEKTIKVLFREDEYDTIVDCVVSSTWRKSHIIDIKTEFNVMSAVDYGKNGIDKIVEVHELTVRAPEEIINNVLNSWIQNGLVVRLTKAEKRKPNEYFVEKEKYDWKR